MKYDYVIININTNSCQITHYRHNKFQESFSHKNNECEPGTTAQVYNTLVLHAVYLVKLYQRVR